MSESTKTTKLRREELHGGAVWRLVLDAPKGNVLDAALTRELADAFRDAARQPRLKVIVLSGAGKHFSFGASVEEHLPNSVAAMLAGFHELFRLIAASGVPVLAAVRGACLGGGLELASFCQRIFAHPEAKLGQPEVQLGVFAPVGSAILAERVGRGVADDLLLSGRTMHAAEAHAVGLVDHIGEDPDGDALAWAEEHLLPRSASSLRFATRAARFDFNRRFENLVADLERLYLDELMQTADAVEGITAFLEKRQPKWEDR
ncbi:MAG: cyclohexa-1,5-dienecarbonyl-CoA hydratase [bacterium]|nr:cyclohexa-1,5-dienecarbonyl-CoA hydratase [bacterium]